MPGRRNQSISSKSLRSVPYTQIIITIILIERFFSATSFIFFLIKIRFFHIAFLKLPPNYWPFNTLTNLESILKVFNLSLNTLILHFDVLGWPLVLRRNAGVLFNCSKSRMVESWYWDLKVSLIVSIKVVISSPCNEGCTLL